MVDHTASQGSLTYDPWHSLLYAGSNTISVFAVSGDRLALRQVLRSGGTFPVSVAVHGDVVYVLNALNGGSLQGYRVLGGFLAPLPGSGRALGLDPTETPQFTSTPGQVAFTPDGSQLIVTTKNNGNDRVAPADGFLFASNAGSADESGFTSSPGGTLSLLGATGTDAGTVDASAAGGFLYVQTGGAGIVDEFSVGAAGSLTKVGSVTVPDAVGGEGIVAS